MMNSSTRERDEFLKALEEARRAALADDDEPAVGRKARAPAFGTSDLLHTVDRMAGKLRAYIPVGLLSRLYNDGFSRAAPKEDVAPEPVDPPKSELEQVVDELHLTSNLSSKDLKLIRRRFAKSNHPDRVPPAVRDEATRRMTIANSLIDEALRGSKTPGR